MPLAAVMRVVMMAAISDIAVLSLERSEQSQRTKEAYTRYPFPFYRVDKSLIGEWSSAWPGGHQGSFSINRLPTFFSLTCFLAISCILHFSFTDTCQRSGAECLTRPRRESTLAENNKQTCERAYFFLGFRGGRFSRVATTVPAAVMSATRTVSDMGLLP